MREVADRPHPRALFMGLDESDVQQLRAIFPTSKEIVSRRQVLPEEWDVLITTDDDPLPGVDVISFMDRGILGSIEGDFEPAVRIRSKDGRSVSVSRNILIAEAAPAKFKPLLRAMAEVALNEDDHSCVLYGQTRIKWYGGRLVTTWTSTVQPLLATAEGHVIAGQFVRSGGFRHFTLPATPNLVDWVRECVAYWGEDDPERYAPQGAAWERDPAWQTQEEAAARATLATAEAQRQAAIAHHDGQVALAHAALEDAHQRGDRGARVLLAGTGTELVEEVIAALTDIGFDVENMDLVWPANDMREDLRVRDPLEADWVAMAEVKGYGKAGPKTSDTQNLTGRFQVRFVKDEGREPSVMWYIVNGQYEQSPTQRTHRLSVGDTQAFADNNGLYIPSVQLFRLRGAVLDGLVTSEGAKILLKAARGHFAY